VVQSKILYISTILRHIMERLQRKYEPFMRDSEGLINFLRESYRNRGFQMNVYEKRGNWWDFLIRVEDLNTSIRLYGFPDSLVLETNGKYEKQILESIIDIAEKYTEKYRTNSSSNKN
jgi:hypothetical protein